jgi:hypothetical protein
MPPKSKPPKKSPKPSKASKAKPRARRAAAAGTEPEVLNQDTVAADAHTAAAEEHQEPAPAHRKPLKTHKALDQLAEYLAEQSEPLLLVRAVIETVYGGPCAPDRELATLRLLKEDERFTITAGTGGVNKVGLAVNAGADQVNAEAPAVNEPAAAAPAKTLGDHVAEADGRPQRILWPHRLGSSVLLLTDGQPPKRALIRNIHDHGAFVLYDLTIEAGGTIDGLPAHRIGRDLDREGELADLRIENAALRRHAEKGAELAQRHIQMAAVERQLAEALKKHRENMEAVVSQLEEHARSEPGQTDLRDVVGESAPPAPSRGAKLKAPPAPAEDKLADQPPAAAAASAAEPAAPPAALAPKSIAERVAADDLFDLDEFELTLEQLLAATVNQSTASTGKPQTIKPVDLGTDLGAHVVAAAINGVAILLPVYTKAQWKAEMSALGAPLALPSDEVPERLRAAGHLTGLPVRVGRAVLYVGAEVDAVLLRLPPADAPPEKLTGKDAAAGG